MSTADYETILEQARQLTPEERQRLAEQLIHEIDGFRAIYVSDTGHIAVEERAQVEAWLASSEELARRVSAAWKDDMNAVEAVKEQRREL